MGKYYVEIVHVVEFNDHFEVEADTEEAAVEKAKGEFVEKPEQSTLIEVHVAEVERLPPESNPEGDSGTPGVFDARTESRHPSTPHTGFSGRHQMRFVLPALDEVLDYLWDDEVEDFVANRCPEGHVFRSIEFLRLWAFRARGELHRRRP